MPKHGGGSIVHHSLKKRVVKSKASIIDDVPDGKVSIHSMDLIHQMLCWQIFPSLRKAFVEIYHKPTCLVEKK
jgi:hypothetical protein